MLCVSSKFKFFSAAEGSRFQVPRLWFTLVLELGFRLRIWQVGFMILALVKGGELQALYQVRRVISGNESRENCVISLIHSTVVNYITSGARKELNTKQWLISKLLQTTEPNSVGSSLSTISGNSLVKLPILAVAIPTMTNLARLSGTGGKGSLRF